MNGIYEEVINKVCSQQPIVRTLVDKMVE